MMWIKLSRTFFSKYLLWFNLGIHSEKESQHRTAEDNLSAATKRLQTIEATISGIQKQLDQKQVELKGARN